MSYGPDTTQTRVPARLAAILYAFLPKPCPAGRPWREANGDPGWEEPQSGKGPSWLRVAGTHPLSCDDEDGRADGARVHAVAPAVVVDPHGDGQDAEHHQGRPLGLVEVGQRCSGRGRKRQVSGLRGRARPPLPQGRPLGARAWLAPPRPARPRGPAAHRNPSRPSGKGGLRLPCLGRPGSCRREAGPHAKDQG